MPHPFEEEMAKSKEYKDIKITVEDQYVDLRELDERSELVPRQFIFRKTPKKKKPPPRLCLFPAGESSEDREFKLLRLRELYTLIEKNAKLSNKRDKTMSKFHGNDRWDPRHRRYVETVPHFESNVNKEDLNIPLEQLSKNSLETILLFDNKCTMTCESEVDHELVEMARLQQNLAATDENHLGFIDDFEFEEALDFGDNLNNRNNDINNYDENLDSKTYNADDEESQAVVANNEPLGVANNEPPVVANNEPQESFLRRLCPSDEIYIAAKMVIAVVIGMILCMLLILFIQNFLKPKHQVPLWKYYVKLFGNGLLFFLTHLTNGLREFLSNG